MGPLSNAPPIIPWRNQNGTDSVKLCAPDGVIFIAVSDSSGWHEDGVMLSREVLRQNVVVSRGGVCSGAKVLSRNFHSGVANGSQAVRLIDSRDSRGATDSEL